MKYKRLQRFKKLIFLHVLTVEKFVLHLAAEFLCEQKSLFWRRQKS